MTGMLPFMLAVSFAALGVVFSRAPGDMNPKTAKTAGILFIVAAVLFIIGGIINLVRGA